MPSSSGLNHRIKGRLGESSLEDWADSLPENSPGETTPPLYRVSRLELIAASLHYLPGLVVLSILWLVSLIALVFGFILLTSWEIPEKVFIVNSTAALRLESRLGGWTNRKLYCTPSQPCDASNPFSKEGPSNLRYEIQLEEDEVKTV